MRQASRAGQLQNVPWSWLSAARCMIYHLFHDNGLGPVNPVSSTCLLHTCSDAVCHAFWCNLFSICRRQAVSVSCRLVEQRQLAERQRIRGNELFKQKRFSEAYQCYEIGLDAERHSMTLHANAAMASLKLQCWIQAIEHCDKVLHRPEGILALHDARVYKCHAKCYDMLPFAIAVPRGNPIGLTAPHRVLCRCCMWQSSFTTGPRILSVQRLCRGELWPARWGPQASKALEMAATADQTYIVMGVVMLQALRHFSEAVSDLKAALAIEPANKELGSQLQQAELALSESKLYASVQAKLCAAAQNQSPAKKGSGAPRQPAPAKALISQNGEQGEVGGIRAVHAASLQPAAATGSASSSSKLGAVADACKRLRSAGVCMLIAADLEVMHLWP